MIERPNCAKRIEGELRQEIKNYKNALAAQEAMTELALDSEDVLNGRWPEAVIENRRAELLEKVEARQIWNLLAQVENGDLSLPENFDPLWVENVSVLHVQLSWGGPADGFYIWLSPEGEINNIVYYFQDWFDGAEKKLTDNDFNIAEKYLSQALCAYLEIH